LEEVTSRCISNLSTFLCRFLLTFALFM